MTPPTISPMRSILLGGHGFTLHKLSCMEVIQSFALCDQLRETLTAQGLDDVTANALTQHAVLAYLALYQEGDGDDPIAPAFSSLEDLLSALTLEDLLAVYRHYHAHFGKTEQEDSDVTLSTTT